MSDVVENQPSKEEKGFFASLFDFRFEQWVTLRVAGVLYAITIALVVVFGVVSFIGLLFSGEALGILGAFVGVPLGVFLLILLSRLTFEATIALVAVAKNTESLRRD